MSAFTLYIDNDNLITLSGLTNPATGAYVNDATVQLVSLLDSTSTEVTGVSWPLSMSYVSSSNGDYRGTIDKLAALTNGARYTGSITAVSGTLDAEWLATFVAKIRRAKC